MRTNFPNDRYESLSSANLQDCGRAVSLLHATVVTRVEVQMIPEQIAEYEQLKQKMEAKLERMRTF